jgi:hypothetical protein
VRIPEIRRETILKPLDSGAAGLLVPQVNTAEQAKEVIQYAKYPTAGNRGVALRRAANMYARLDAAAYLQKANEDTFIAVQAESEQAIENIDAITAVDGVDCVFVGPFDLSVSLGIPGQVVPVKRQWDRLAAAAATCLPQAKAPPKPNRIPWRGRRFVSILCQSLPVGHLRQDGMAVFRQLATDHESGQGAVGNGCGPSTPCLPSSISRGQAWIP